MVRINKTINRTRSNRGLVSSNKSIINFAVSGLEMKPLKTLAQNLSYWMYFGKSNEWLMAWNHTHQSKPGFSLANLIEPNPSIQPRLGPTPQPALVNDRYSLGIASRIETLWVTLQKMSREDRRMEQKRRIEGSVDGTRPRPYPLPLLTLSRRFRVIDFVGPTQRKTKQKPTRNAYVSWTLTFGGAGPTYVGIGGTEENPFKENYFFSDGSHVFIQFCTVVF